MLKSILLSFCVVAAFAGVEGNAIHVKSSKTCSVAVVCDEEGEWTTEWKPYGAGKSCQSAIGGGEDQEAEKRLEDRLEDRFKRIDDAIADVNMDNANAREEYQQLEIRVDEGDEKYDALLEQVKKSDERNRIIQELLADDTLAFTFGYNSKYFFGSFPSPSRTFTYSDSANLCAEHGGRPANVYGSGHYDKIVTYMRRSVPSMPHSYVTAWTGMKVDPEEAKYFLFDGQTLASYLNWYQPSWDVYPKAGGGRTGMSIHIDENVSSDAQGMFNYAPANGNNGVICEVNPEEIQD